MTSQSYLCHNKDDNCATQGEDWVEVLKPSMN